MNGTWDDTRAQAYSVPKACVARFTSKTSWWESCRIFHSVFTLKYRAYTYHNRTMHNACALFCAHVYIYIYIYMCVCVYMCIYIYIYITIRGGISIVFVNVFHPLFSFWWQRLGIDTLWDVGVEGSQSKGRQSTPQPLETCVWPHGFQSIARCQSTCQEHKHDVWTLPSISRSQHILVTKRMLTRDRSCNWIETVLPPLLFPLFVASTVSSHELKRTMSRWGFQILAPWLVLTWKWPFKLQKLWSLGLSFRFDVMTADPASVKPVESKTLTYHGWWRGQTGPGRSAGSRAGPGGESYMARHINSYMMWPKP